MAFLSDPETFWLNMTNIILGVVTVVCLAVVGRALLQEVRARMRNRALAAVPADDHAFVEPHLGLIMADGGERLDRPANDEKHIVRSEN